MEDREGQPRPTNHGPQLGRLTKMVTLRSRRTSNGRQRRDADDLQPESRSGLKGAEGPHEETSGIRQKIIKLDKKYHVFKVAKFAFASGAGFLLAEGILTLGVLLLYGKVTAPADAYSSGSFLGIDVAALALGVALSFFLNEHFTVHHHRTHENSWSDRLPLRLLKFEGVNALGNVAIIAVQGALLLTLAITPVIGNVVGAIASYPITYLISMRFVWKTKARAPAGKGQPHVQIQPKKAGPLLPPVLAMLFLASLYAIGRAVRRRR